MKIFQGEGSESSAGTETNLHHRNSFWDQTIRRPRILPFVRESAAQRGRKAAAGPTTLSQSNRLTSFALFVRVSITPPASLPYQGSNAHQPRCRRGSCEPFFGGDLAYRWTRRRRFMCSTVARLDIFRMPAGDSWFFERPGPLVALSVKRRRMPWGYCNLRSASCYGAS